jgi:5,10-methylenetetrahydromethanopterin reductase
MSTSVKRGRIPRARERIRRVPAAFDLGIVPREPAPQVLALCVEAEALGLDGLWVADSQSVFREALSLLGACAASTDRVLLSTGVTNPVTRHPAVLASAFATLAELAPGRVALAIGRGESAVHTAGLRPASVETLDAAVRCLRELLAGREGSWRGSRLRLSWRPSFPVPIVVCASGPRTLELAGRIGDGVLFQVGADPALVRYALRHVEAGAGESGRTLADLLVCARVGCSVDEDPDLARAEAMAYGAVAAKTVFDSVPAGELPEELALEARELRERYSYAEHAGAGAVQAGLLSERVLDAVVVSGTPADAVVRLRAVADLGVDRLVCPLVASDPRHQLRLLAERVAPGVRSQSPT